MGGIQDKQKNNQTYWEVILKYKNYTITMGTVSYDVAKYVEGEVVA